MDTAAAVKAQGLRFGTYYSLLEWFHPLFENHTQQYVQEHMLPQMHDLVEKLKVHGFGSHQLLFKSTLGFVCSPARIQAPMS